MNLVLSADELPQLIDRLRHWIDPDTPVDEEAGEHHVRRIVEELIEALMGVNVEPSDEVLELLEDEGLVIDVENIIARYILSITVFDFIRSVRIINRRGDLLLQTDMTIEAVGHF